MKKKTWEAAFGECQLPLPQKEGIKETESKLVYDVDFDFIKIWQRECN